MWLYKYTQDVHIFTEFYIHTHCTHNCTFSFIIHLWHCLPILELFYQHVVTVATVVPYLARGQVCYADHVIGLYISFSKHLVTHMVKLTLSTGTYVYIYVHGRMNTKWFCTYTVDSGLCEMLYKLYQLNSD